MESQLSHSHSLHSSRHHSPEPHDGLFAGHHHGHNVEDPTSGDIFTHFIDDSEDHPTQHGHHTPHHQTGHHMQHHPIHDSMGTSSYSANSSATMSASASGSSSLSSSRATLPVAQGTHFALSPTTLEGASIMGTPVGRAARTPKPRSSRSRKGRPTKMLAPPGTPTGTAYVNVGRAFPGITMVYRCPFVYCHRFYATKLALKRHFLVYNHMVTTEHIDFDPNPSLSPEEVKRKAILSMPRCFRCPVLECCVSFEDVYQLCGHFNESHHAITEPIVSKRSKSCQPHHDLMEWTEMYDDCIDATMNFVIDLALTVPDMFQSREDKASWRFMSIFDIVGPRPIYKRAQFIHYLRESLLKSYRASHGPTLLVNEDTLKLMVSLTFCEMMPAGYLLTRDYAPSEGAHLDQDGILDPWNDEPFLWQINTESTQSMLKYGAVHSSRNYVKKTKIRKSLGPEGAGDDGSAAIDELSDSELSNDRFVCQIPGCGRIFASVPAYKYHMGHFEHDIEALLGSSSLLRQVLFPHAESLAGSSTSEGSGDYVNMNDGVNWYSYERLNLRFVSGFNDQEEDGHGTTDPSRIEQPLINLVFSMNDAVHILHGYIDQQLAVVFSWQWLRKRESIAINPLTSEFTLTFKKGDHVSMLKAAANATVPLTTAPVKRKKKPFTFPSSGLLSGLRRKAGANGHIGIVHGEEGLSLGLDPYTVTKAIGQGSGSKLSIKYLPAGHVMGYQSSKHLLPIHPTSSLTKSEDESQHLSHHGQHGGTSTNSDPEGGLSCTGPSGLEGAQVATWLDYNSVINEEPINLQENRSPSHFILHPTAATHKANVGGSVQTCSLRETESFILEGGQDGISVLVNPGLNSTQSSGQSNPSTPLVKLADNRKGSLDLNVSNIDWFPFMALLTSSNEMSSGGRLRYLAACIVSQGGCLSLYNVVLLGASDDDVASGKSEEGYTIESIVFNSSLIDSHLLESYNDTKDAVSSESNVPSAAIASETFVEGKNYGDSDEHSSDTHEGNLNASTVTGLSFYPFALQADTNEADLKGILAVLRASGEIGVYVLPRHLLFPSNITSAYYIGQLVHLRPVCTLSLPMYSISAFCWNRQQTILPMESIGGSTVGSGSTGTMDINGSGGSSGSTVVMTTQMLLGTVEGSLGICDLSIPLQPQMLMLIPAHASMITSLQWSPLNPLNVLSASADGSVLHWNLQDVYHPQNLLRATMGPVTKVDWAYRLSKPYDARTALQDLAFPHGITLSSSTASSAEEFSHSSFQKEDSLSAQKQSASEEEAVLTDPARSVIICVDNQPPRFLSIDAAAAAAIVTGDSNAGNTTIGSNTSSSSSFLLPVCTSGKCISAIYPNTRLMAPVMAVVGTHSGQINLHAAAATPVLPGSTNLLPFSSASTSGSTTAITSLSQVAARLPIGTWQYDASVNTFSLLQQQLAPISSMPSSRSRDITGNIDMDSLIQPTDRNKNDKAQNISVDGKMNASLTPGLSLSAVAWHPLPIGLFGVVGSPTSLPNARIHKKSIDATTPTDSTVCTSDINGLLYIHVL